MRDFKPPSGPGDLPALSENARIVLQSRYLAKDSDGECVETPAEMFNRVASTAAEAEARYGAGRGDIAAMQRRFYSIMSSLEFLPNSPALINASRPGGMLSACFVLPVEDSIEAIFEAVKSTALIQKAGGGTGFSFDRLRPSGDSVASNGGTTPGPVSFWRVFSETTDAIQQGVFRRGANMGMLSVEHPDILKFLFAKQDIKVFTSFNVSVKIPDAWMKTLASGGDVPHVVRNPRTGKKYMLPRNLDVGGYTIKDLAELTGGSQPPKSRRFYCVRDIWKMIVRCAHATGEPGIAFIDRINRDNPTPSLGEIEATNPCGEQPLLPYEACTLGSINLARFVGREGEIEWDRLGQVVHLGVRFLDDMVDACTYPIRNSVQLAQANRKIGLGVMGFADCLFLMGIPYDSEQGVEYGRTLMGFVDKAARQASAKLADARGPFPNWSQSTWRIERNMKVRNAAITCVAPTGTISIIADCSSGIEPLYSPVFIRRILGGRKLMCISSVFKEVMRGRGLYDSKLERRILARGSIRDIKTIPSGIRRVFRCAYDIAPRWHVRMQAAFQENCDAAVSKTINFRESATASAVDKAFMLAYDLGCKGITAYRRGSRPDEPMSLC